MSEEKTKKREFHWPTVLWYIHLHALGLYGLVLLFTEAMWLTVFFTFFIILIAYLGVSGAHRLWAHQTYTATTCLRLVLILAHTLVGVGPMHDWVLAHRIHHRFLGTDKDPYNHKKGFLYSHVFSNLLTIHPDQQKFEKDIDMRDVESDILVWIQRKFYWILFIIVGLLLPINAPVEYWDESIKNSVFILGFTRLAITVNISWLVNSAMLVWGLNPGDKFPADDNSVFILNKSYWPNYHYLLPWDWKSGEFGTYDRGFGTFFIKFLDNLGLISCLKTASSEDIREVLGKAATTKLSIDECLENLKKLGEEKAIKTKLQYHH